MGGVPSRELFQEQLPISGYKYIILMSFYNY